MPRKYSNETRKLRKFHKSLVDTQRMIERAEQKEERRKRELEHNAVIESKRGRGHKSKDIIKNRAAPGEGLPRKERRMRNRKVVLPLNRICPDCGKLTLKSRSWVIVKCSEENANIIRAICLKCYRNSQKSAF